ncbi:Dot/Icm T4SS effector LegC2/YlfB [Legionella pneumophila serogroup 1]|uniref:Dot/Icm T4SS effector LegC2/YlfB n=1 Tax=Legionella pneumophila TaxID=446 RepID=UPI000770B26F|nr:Dot/Icm T4SS effector LegC2/YlfB [Legionella pneumophila]HAT8944864.1 microtubule-binding protein [Legionella pneumophila subsp. pneumophila]MCH9060154.1 Dot/Icm T4SS effector LegC2/YlfB [Legionella pneumophila serogroup 1]MCH9064157.1 Dot/Icm T4SS effector LegC2/YlfB [Legionella pneumophila serogroup 1]MCH9065510.1 Dot/Icm T4SS effector LegC2/YlfB [Legionella pneumophila serogroup 1]MCH9070051.1 Dot/Icm T4SS effector LegC2/YlfB [Legionella pneumophila serogroup 1]
MTDTPKANLSVDEIKEDTPKNQPLPEENTEILVKKLKVLETTQENFDQIKKHIAAVIDSLAKNRSFFGRVAAYWGEMQLWLKITLGIVLVVPTLTLGIAIQVASLIVVSVLTLVTYVGSALLLENHVQKEEHITDRLKEEMIGLADNLGKVIESFEPLRKQIAEQIEYFHKENDRLNLNVTQLSDHIMRLTKQAEQLQKTEQTLRKVREELEKTSETLDEKVQVQTELLQINQEELNRIREEIAKNEIELSEKISELDQVKKEMSVEIEKAETVTQVLKNTVEKLSQTAIADHNHRESFQNKLNDFLSNKEQSFNDVAQRICEAERELCLVKEELNFSNKRYQELLERQEEVVKRLEQLQLSRKPTPYSNAKVLGKLGIMATEEKEYPTPVSPEENTIPTQTLTG